ncbi:hypothetical protein C0992_006139 [Termitomyces sp. T32_za158]|nr:hypothetical protein C0992_006139 [Termitomyces sp. T32_za158]
MRRQHISALKQIEHAMKRKLPSQEGASTESRWVKPLPVQVWAEPTELLFMKAVTFPSPPSQLIMVKLTTNLCTPVQYNGLVATSAVGKGKQQAVPAIENDSNYSQSHSKEEEEVKEGEMAAERFQRIQQIKKLAKKKANRMKAATALAHKVQNDFSGCISDGLGVKVWGPLNVEWLNTCFREAISPCCYYLYKTNTVFVRADVNCTAVFELSSGQLAKVPGTMVYKFAHQGFSSTLYKLKRLYKYYSQTSHN